MGTSNSPQKEFRDQYNANPRLFRVEYFAVHRDKPAFVLCFPLALEDTEETTVTQQVC